MLTFPNYRITLKKNSITKALTNFTSLVHIQNKKNILKQKEIDKQNSKSITITEKLLSHNLNTLYNKTFIFDSTDYYLKKILQNNEWKNFPSNIPNTKLKWVCIAKAEHFNSLQKGQLINHFKDSYRLTTKLGLYNLLSNPHNDTLTNLDNRSYLGFYPRSYDVGSDLQSFQKDFQHTSILNLMKKIMIHIEIQHETRLYEKYKKICQTSSFQLTDQNLRCLLRNYIYQSNNQNLYNLKENKIFVVNSPFQSEHIMINKNIFIFLIKYFYCLMEGKKFSSSKLQSLMNYSKLNPPFKDFSQHYYQKQENVGFLTHEAGIMFFRLYNFCLQNFKYFINDGLNNIWIVKANEGSRGRNISLVNSIQQMRIYQTNGGNRLVQKYIENVWILNNIDQIQNQRVQKYNKISRILHRKFDIRFWVLVKSFLPLNAYFFSQGYLRLSSKNYNFTEQNLSKNLKAHLTNYSINYHHKQNKKLTLQDQQSSYLLFSDFSQYLQSIGSIQSKNHLLSKIKQKILFILQTASNNWRQSDTDQHSFELFGFDIVLDSNLQPFVLQCNMSPACHERGELKDLIKQMGQGLLRLTGILENNSNYKDSKWQKLVSKTSKQNYQKGNHLKISSYMKKSLINNVNQIQVTGYSLNMDEYQKKDRYLNLYEKTIYLQHFFINRYKAYTNVQCHKGKYKKKSNICLLIEVLARVCKKEKQYWTKKLIKHSKKYIKKKLLKSYQ